MLINFVVLALKCLMAASVLLGLISLFFSGPTTVWKGLGLWGLGLGAGNAAVVLSFYLLTLQGRERAALRAAGKQVPLNDMAGFGQTMLAAFGLMYFAALLAIIGGAFASALIWRQIKRPAR